MKTTIQFHVTETKTQFLDGLLVAISISLDFAQVGSFVLLLVLPPCGYWIAQTDLLLQKQTDGFPQLTEMIYIYIYTLLHWYTLISLLPQYGLI